MPTLLWPWRHFRLWSTSSRSSSKRMQRAAAAGSPGSAASGATSAAEATSAAAVAAAGMLSCKQVAALVACLTLALLSAPLLHTAVKRELQRLPADCRSSRLQLQPSSRQWRNAFFPWSQTVGAAGASSLSPGGDTGGEKDGGGEEAAGEGNARWVDPDEDLGRTEFVRWRVRDNLLRDEQDILRRNVLRRETSLDSLSAERAAVSVFSCPLKYRAGPWGEGGKWLCLLPQYLHGVQKPVVYSIGSDGETSFEQSVSELLRVRAFTFDPTLQPDQKQRVENASFLRFSPLGLAARDSHHPDTARLVTAEAMMALHHHSFVDVFKVDCESCEEEFVDELVRRMPRHRPYFGQVLMEIHRLVPMDTENERLVRTMESMGYMPFSAEENFLCPECFEIAFIHESLVQPGRAGVATATRNGGGDGSTRSTATTTTTTTTTTRADTRTSRRHLQDERTPPSLARPLAAYVNTAGAAGNAAAGRRSAVSRSSAVGRKGRVGHADDTDEKPGPCPDALLTLGCLIPAKRLDPERNRPLASVEHQNDTMAAAHLDVPRISVSPAPHT